MTSFVICQTLFSWGLEANSRIVSRLSLCSAMRWSHCWQRPEMALHQRRMTSRCCPAHELTLLRHGECVDDATHTFAGWRDCDLTPVGVAQAQRAGRTLRTQYHIAYTSELARAQSTVRHVLAPLFVEPKVYVTWRLNARHYGDLTGYTRAQMARTHGAHQMAHWLTAFAGLPPPLQPHRADNIAGANTAHAPRTESPHMVCERVLPYWTAVIAPALRMRNRIIVVAHNDSLRALIMHFAQLTGDEMMRITLPPAVPITFALDHQLQMVRRPRDDDVMAKMAPSAIV